MTLYVVEALHNGAVYGIYSTVELAMSRIQELGDYHNLKDWSWRIEEYTLDEFFTIY